VILNAEPTPFDDLADAVIRGAIGEILLALCRSNSVRLQIYEPTTRSNP
jgi:hypothetical protein